MNARSGFFTRIFVRGFVKSLIIIALTWGGDSYVRALEPEKYPGEAGLGFDTELAAPAHLCMADWYYGRSRLNALTFKVNAVAAALAVTNASFELEWRRWSVQLPVYYSNLDYFSHRVKFRTIAMRPSLRFWFSPDRVVGHTGFFAGVHFGMAWYNVAMGGIDRIQDHGGHTPALGGGIEAGWRMPLGRSGHWKFELSLGVGAYKARYDRIDNTTGVLKAYRNRTIFCVDNLGVSFGYSLDLKKKGGVVPW